MKGAFKRISGVIIALMMIATMMPSLVFAGSQFDSIGVPSTAVPYRHNGGHSYDVQDPDWVPVYCLDPAKGYSDKGKNMDFRWKVDLKNNAWLLNSNQQDVNGSDKPTADHINRLVSILWKAEELGANNDDTQNAVWWFVTQGADDDYAGNISMYNNYIVEAAGDSGWAVPSDYELYLYAADNEAPGYASVQNMVRFASTASTSNTPEGKLSTTVSAGGETASADKAAQLSAEKAESLDTVTDQIDYEGLKGGATYKVQGTLVELGDADDGSADVEIAKSESKECVADDSGSGTWEIEFTGLKGKLKAGKKYVVYEKATNKDDENDVIEHANRDDTAQTIVVDEKKPEDENPNNPPNDEPPVVEETPDNPDEGLSDNPNDEAPVLDDTPESSETTSVVNTGDSTEIVSWAIALAVSCVLLAYVTMNKKERYLPKH